jgi:hypothetical protein
LDLDSPVSSVSDPDISGISDNKQKKTGTSNKKTPESYTPKKKKNTEGKVRYRPWLYKVCRKQACMSMLMSIPDFGIYMFMAFNLNLGPTTISWGSMPQPLSHASDGTAVY